MNFIFTREESNLILLYSGGADSRLMLQFAMDLGRKPHCVLIDYGQKHIKELMYAIGQLKDLNISYQVVKIDGLNINSGLTGSLDDQRWENVHAMNVPGRNTIFIGIAYSIAENMDIDEIWYGPDYSDAENKFPDCYQDYVVRMNKVLEVSGVRPLKLRAPLLGWTKEMIIQYLREVCEINVDAELHSGYEETGNIEDNKCTCYSEEVCECNGIYEKHQV